MGDRPIIRPPLTQDSTTPKRVHPSVPKQGLEPTIPVFERSKVIRILDSGHWDRCHVPVIAIGAHPASHPVGNRGSFPGGKAAGCEADHSPPSSAEVKECVEFYLHSPHMLSWRGAQFKKIP
jgi:hypothetical protein